MIRAIPASEETGVIMPANCVAGRTVKNGSAEKRGDLRARERRNQHAVGSHRSDIDQHPQEQRRKASLERNLERRTTPSGTSM